MLILLEVIKQHQDSIKPSLVYVASFLQRLRLPINFAQITKKLLR